MLNVKLTEEEFEIVLKALNIAGSVEPGNYEYDNLFDAITYEGRVNGYV
jgi:hypothetical protein